MNTYRTIKNIIIPDRFFSRVTSSSKPCFCEQRNSAEVVLMMRPDDELYLETRLRILAARYFGSGS